MFLAFVTLLAGLAISGVAIYYSVIGLAAIFAAAAIPVIIMGTVLEVSKLIAAWWLKWNWYKAPAWIKYYLLIAVLVLMLITSMGIFGFLSKAHVEQEIPAGDAISQIEFIDESIALNQEIIQSSRATLAILDSQIREFTDRGFVTRGVNARNEQRPERELLNSEIANAQAEIMSLREQRAPLASTVRTIEAETGPIRYIAQFIYDDTPSKDLLEKAVIWVIIIIIFVFDPLAVLLLLSSQLSFRWALEERKQRKEKLEATDHEPIKEPTSSLGLSESENQELAKILAEDPKPVKIEDALESTPVEPDVVAEDPVEDPVEETRADYTQPEDVVTEGVTYQENDGGYVCYDGKQVKKEALRELHCELFDLSVDDDSGARTGFGTKFPKIAKDGDTFIRVDLLPNRVYRFKNRKWVEINKEGSSDYLFDERYLQYLISKIEEGEYDVNLLSEKERSQIKTYLENTQNN